jgi:hypothetical protein
MGACLWFTHVYVHSYVRPLRFILADNTKAWSSKIASMVVVINEADYVCPYNEPLDKFANIGIRRLSKDELWKKATHSPLLRRGNFEATVAQYNTICAFGGAFETCDVRDEPVSARPLQFDPSGVWNVLENDEFNTSWLSPSYIWDGVKYVPDLLIRPVQEIDTPTWALTPYPQGFQCPLWVTYKPEQKHQRPNCCEGKQEYFTALSNKWADKSTLAPFLWHKMINTKTVRHIKKVMCFGLGTLKTDQSFLLHTVTAMIVQSIGVKQGARPRLGVCDEGYCDAAASMLRKFFLMGVHNRLDALRLVDEHTFVICMHPREAISQFVVDLCYDEGGPAALLNRGVYNDGRCIVECVGGKHVSTCGQDYSSPLLYAWANYCKANGRHVSLEDRFDDGKLHDELATFGQAGVEVYWSQSNEGDEIDST